MDLTRWLIGKWPHNFGILQTLELKLLGLHGFGNLNHGTSGNGHPLLSFYGSLWILRATWRFSRDSRCKSYTYIYIYIYIYIQIYIYTDVCAFVMQPVNLGLIDLCTISGLGHLTQAAQTGSLFLMKNRQFEMFSRRTMKKNVNSGKPLANWSIYRWFMLVYRRLSPEMGMDQYLWKYHF